METLVMPSEKPHKDIIKRISKLDKYLPKPPFYILIQGPVKSGKSSVLQSLIVNYQKSHYFDLIFVFLGTQDSRGVFDKFSTKKTDVKIFPERSEETGKLIPFKDSDLQEIMDDLEDAQRELKRMKKRPLQALFVFDDFIFHGMASHHKDTAVDRLIINRRHFGASVIVCSQVQTKLNMNMRANNVSLVIIMRANRKDLENIAKEHNAGVVSEKEFMSIYDEIKAGGKYDYMVVDYEQPLTKIFGVGLGNPLDLEKMKS